MKKGQSESEEESNQNERKDTEEFTKDERYCQKAKRKITFM